MSNQHPTKLSRDTIERYKRLSEDKRERVEELVRKHARACRESRSPIESMNIVWVEAMDLVAKGLDGEREWTEDEKWGQATTRSYEVYVKGVEE